MKQRVRASLLRCVERQLAHRFVEPEAGRMIYAVLQLVGKVTAGDAGSKGKFVRRAGARSYRAPRLDGRFAAPGPVSVAIGRYDHDGAAISVNVRTEYLDANEPVVKIQLQKAGTRLAQLLDTTLQN